MAKQASTKAKSRKSIATFEIPAAAVRAAQACQARGDVRYYLNGVFFGKNGDVAGSNGHVLAATATDCRDLDSDIILAIDGNIPAKAETASFNVEAGFCRTDNGKLFAIELIEGKFPDFRKVIKDNKPTKTVSQFSKFNASYLALVAKVFGASSGVLFYPSIETRAALFKKDQTQLLIMPMHSGLDNEQFEVAA